MNRRPSDRPSRNPTPKAHSYIAERAATKDGGDAPEVLPNVVPTNPAPPRASATIPIILLRCGTLTQFSRLYVGHIRAGKLRLAKDITAERGRVFVRAILPGGVEIDFPGELVDEGDSAVVRFDPVPADVHERVARMVSGGK